MSDVLIESSLEELDEIVNHLTHRVKDGDKLYIHCWGGQGRTVLVSACVLGALYGTLWQHGCGGSLGAGITRLRSAGACECADMCLGVYVDSMICLEWQGADK